MDSCCPDIIALPYVSQIYSYSRTASSEALGLESMGFTVGSSAGAEVLSPELAAVLSVSLVDVELSLSVVVVELSEVLSEDVLSETIEVLELSSLLEAVLSAVLDDELSVLLDVGFSVLLVVVELSAVLELVVDELPEELIDDELSEVLGLSASAEQDVIDTANTKAVIIAIKRFINVIPFI